MRPKRRSRLEQTERGSQAAEALAPHFADFIRLICGARPGAATSEGALDAAAEQVTKLVLHPCARQRGCAEEIDYFIKCLGRHFGVVLANEKATRMGPLIDAAIVEHGQQGVLAKQRLASAVNSILRDHEAELISWDSLEPCILLAINDAYGGKFVYSEKTSKKRKDSTRDIKTLLPFTVTVSAGPRTVARVPTSLGKPPS